MNNRYYVLVVTKTSTDTETREFTPYNDLTVAQRKYHEALTGIGAGSKAIGVLLLDPWLNVIQKEIWTEPVVETEPEETPTEETEPIEETQSEE